jgi:GT2 family glycosyltransferase
MPTQSRQAFGVEAEEICQLKEQLESVRRGSNKVAANGSGNGFDLGLAKKLRRAMVAARSGISKTLHSPLGASITECLQMFGSDADFRIVVETAYHLIHGREPYSNERTAYEKLLKNGTPLTTVVAAIAKTSDAKQIAREKAFLFAKLETGTAEQQIALAIRLVYHRWLGREPDESGLHHHLSLLRNGLSVSAFSMSIANSPEAKAQQHRPDVPDIANPVVANGSGTPGPSSDSLSEVIKVVYRHFLKRDPDPDGAGAFLAAIENGLPLAKFIDEVANCEEAKQVKSAMAFASLSDGQFILRIAEILFQGGGANPKQVEYFKAYLREDPSRRLSLINQLVSEHFNRLGMQNGNGYSPHICWVMGTSEMLTREQWNDRASQLAETHRGRVKSPAIPLEERTFRHSGEFVVSAIASLYRGRSYLEQFLENITSQTLFDRSELIIIDADSPEGEQELIEKYQKVYSNIVYKRINFRLGIYEAWNEGIRVARGRYFTNTNLDDLRRRDSFELQAAALDEYPFVDVVYQDFYYSFDSHLEFEQVAEYGFKSNVPIVTPNNLLCFNSPHNAPMWRAQLHKELGVFDTSFESAGDYEFWLRSMRYGKRFLKLNTPHISYFQNPAGISTSLETKGIEEAHRLIRKYARELTSPYLTMSREELARQLEIAPDWPWDLSTYDVVQKKFRSLRTRTT